MIEQDKTSEEVTVEQHKTPEEPTPEVKWEYKNQFKVVGVMKEVILKTMQATQSEITELKKKLEKLQYGG